MTVFLLVLSLLLNIIALFAIVLLFLRQNKLLETEKKQKRMINEMEESISACLIQMKEENDHFIDRVSKLMVNEVPSIEKNREEGKLKQNASEPSGKNLRSAKASAYQAVRAYKKSSNPDSSRTADADKEIKPLLQANETAIEQQPGQNKTDGESQPEISLLHHVLLLKKQGLTEDEIAKKLGKGRTEIALMLKFRQNQQE